MIHNYSSLVQLLLRIHTSVVFQNADWCNSDGYDGHVLGYCVFAFLGRPKFGPRPWGSLQRLWKIFERSVRNLWNAIDMNDSIALVVFFLLFGEFSLAFVVLLALYSLEQEQREE